MFGFFCEWSGSEDRPLEWEEKKGRGGDAGMEGCVPVTEIHWPGRKLPEQSVRARTQMRKKGLSSTRPKKEGRGAGKVKKKRDHIRKTFLYVLLEGMKERGCSEERLRRILTRGAKGPQKHRVKNSNKIVS